MSVAALLFDVIGPVVVLVAIGAVVGTRLHIHPAPLASSAYWLLGPAFVFDNLYDAELAGDLIVKLVVASLASMLGAGLFAWVITTAAGGQGATRSAAVLTSAYGNVGNAGLAISAFALGDDVLPIASVVMLSINITGLAMGVGLAAARTTTPARALGRALLAPMTVAGALAVIVNAGDVDIPLIVERPMVLMSEAMIPVMLLTLGLQLVRTGLPAWSVALSATIIGKLVIAPLAGAATATALGLDGDAFSVLVIQAAMPPAVFCALIAIEHDYERDRITSAVVATTLVSLATTPVVLALTT
ncbi:MAG: AEC family transporter [Actinomycetota bacterium]